MKKFLKAHLLALREAFPNAWIILIPEGNLGHEASHMAHHVKGMTKVYTLMERKLGQSGVITTHEVKAASVETFEDYLFNNAVSYCKTLVCANPFLNRGTALSLTQKKFEAQLAMFRKIIKVPLTPHGNVTLTFSGKTDHEGKQTGRMQDDLAMALLLNAYWQRRFIRRQTLNVDYSIFFGG
jgi:hypothetical protein